MAPNLLILAAGMGSRYGGLKQLDSMGPSGETLLDYSVFDALRAGFGRIVFVIRHSFERDFREQIGRRYENRVDIDYVFQELDTVPPGYSIPSSRSKPLGTAHAIWCARDQIKAPFGAINADDFYGSDAYLTLARFFKQQPSASLQPTFAMVGYQLGRTLSENGRVARGVCTVEGDGYLQGVEECVGIEKTPSGAQYQDDTGRLIEFSGNETVSMNFWGFTPAIFPMLEDGLGRFLAQNAGNEKAEYYIPSAVAEMIATRKARAQVLSCNSHWFGITYREDKRLVSESIARLVEAGKYPCCLWGKEVA